MDIQKLSWISKTEAVSCHHHFFPIGIKYILQKDYCSVTRIYYLVLKKRSEGMLRIFFN